MSKKEKSTSILLFILLGISGFGVGGAIGGFIWVAFDAPHFGFAVLGAVGGAFLGIASQGWKKAWVMAIASAIGFDIGFLFSFLVLLVIWQPTYGHTLVIGAVGGLTGGASIGLVLKNWRGIGLLSLASAIGFSLAVWLTLDRFRGLTPQILWGAITLAVWGIFGGAFSGLALGYLKNSITKTE
ncbi:MAG: hypothetical protein ACYSSN_11515 [Planctomycetota bacterium]|jgi:hypothetical protein